MGVGVVEPLTPEGDTSSHHRRAALRRPPQAHVGSVEGDVHRPVAFARQPRPREQAVAVVASARDVTTEDPEPVIVSRGCPAGVAPLARDSRRRKQEKGEDESRHTRGSRRSKQKDRAPGECTRHDAVMQGPDAREQPSMGDPGGPDEHLDNAHQGWLQEGQSPGSSVRACHGLPRGLVAERDHLGQVTSRLFVRGYRIVEEVQDVPLCRDLGVGDHLPGGLPNQPVRPIHRRLALV